MTITLTREEAQQLLEVFELFLEEAEDVTTLENNLVKMLRTRIAQPEREWQGLTDEEVGMLTVFDGLHHVEVPLLAEFIRAIEAKLKEKNA
jgi:hypothetical protein